MQQHYTAVSEQSKVDDLLTASVSARVVWLYKSTGYKSASASFGGRYNVTLTDEELGQAVKRFKSAGWTVKPMASTWGYTARPAVSNV